MSSAAPAPTPVVIAGHKPSNAPTYFLLRRLQSLAGILFGGYIMVHLLVNATLIQGPSKFVGQADIYQQQVDKIHSLPFLLGVELTAIYLPLLVHTLYGIYVIVNGKPNVSEYGYIKNWFYFMQRVSAVVLVLFIFFHIAGMHGWFGQTLKFDEHEATGTTIRHLHANPLIWLVIYPLGILCATFHLANGFWTGAISWGLTISNRAQNRWGWICLGLFLFTTGCGFLALVGSFTNHAAAAPPAMAVPVAQAVSGAVR